MGQSLGLRLKLHGRTEIIVEAVGSGVRVRDMMHN